MAREYREAAQRGESLGLNESELVVYDALTNNDSAVRELGDEVLKKIAFELTEKLRNSTSVDGKGARAFERSRGIRSASRSVDTSTPRTNKRKRLDWSSSKRNGCQMSGRSNQSGSQ